LEYFYNPGFLIAGALLLFLPRWGRLAGLVMLPTVVALTSILWTYTALTANSRMQIYREPPLLLIIADLCTVGIYVALAWFLWKGEMSIKDRLHLQQDDS
jgi:hypothetical protein